MGIGGQQSGESGCTPLTISGVEMAGTIDVDYMLKQWAIWAYANRGLSLEYPSIEPYTRMLAKKATGLTIDDEEGQAVDKVVSLLRHSNEAEWDCIARHFIAGQSYRQIAKVYGWKDHRRVSDHITGGKRYIEGLLYSFANR